MEHGEDTRDEGGDVMAARMTVVTVTTRMVVMPGERWRSAVAILEAPGSLQGDVAIAIGHESGAGCNVAAISTHLQASQREGVACQ